MFLPGTTVYITSFVPPAAYFLLSPSLPALPHAPRRFAMARCAYCAAPPRSQRGSTYLHTGSSSTTRHTSSRGRSSAAPTCKWLAARAGRAWWTWGSLFTYVRPNCSRSVQPIPFFPPAHIVCRTCAPASYTHTKCKQKHTPMPHMQAPARPPQRSRPVNSCTSRWRTCAAT